VVPRWAGLQPGLRDCALLPLLSSRRQEGRDGRARVDLEGLSAAGGIPQPKTGDQRFCWWCEYNYIFYFPFRSFSRKML